MRRDFSYPSNQPQGSLDAKRSQLRLQENTFENSNPYSSLLLRGVNQDFSAVRSKSEHIDQGPSSRWDENNQPAQKQQSDLRKGDNNKNLPNYAQGSMWDSVGENSRKKALLNEYQSYMKSNPLPQYVKHRQGNEYNQREENNMLVRKQSSDPAGGGWYTQNNRIGILPGMDEKPENRRNQEFRPLQDKYATNEGSKGGYTPSGGRLAGIGSRILDNPRDYSSVENTRGALDEVQNYRTPQLGPDRDRLGFKFATPQNDKGSQGYNPLQLGRMQSFTNNPYSFNNERGKSFSESLNDLDGFRGAYGQDREAQPKPSFHVKPKQEFTFSFANKISGDWQDQRRQPAQDALMKRGEEPTGKPTYGSDWVSERHKQEEDKKLKQKEQLQKIYRDQIDEKKRKKQEEQRRQLLEDQKEEERLRRENEELQREYVSEQNKKKGIVVEEQPKTYGRAYSKEDMNMDYLVGGKKKSEKPQTNFLETYAQSNYKRELEIPRPFDYKKDDTDDPDVQRIEEIIKEAASKFSNPVIARPKYNYPEQELPLHKGISQYNSTLDDQLEKMKRDIEQHATLIKSELSTYKKQAFDSLELRHNAQNELLMLREELKAQQLQAENNTVEEFGVNGEKGANIKLGQVRSQDRIGLRIPNKNYSKIYCPEDEGQDLEVAPSTSLNVETQYMSAKGGNQKYKELPKVEEMLHKFGNDRDNSATAVGSKDAAMQKFSMLFPSHGARDQENGNTPNIEYKSYGNAGGMEYDENQNIANRRVNNYEARQVGRDEVQGTSNFMSRANGKTRFGQDNEEDYELPGSQELVEPQQ